MPYGDLEASSTTSPSRHHSQLPRPTGYKPSLRHHHDSTALRSFAPHASGGDDALPGVAMDLDADVVPTSPSADSSPSSSDLDTESTGSFFPDRSTTLGTLMGVSAFGGGGQRRASVAPAAESASGEERDRAQRAAREEEDERRTRRRRRRLRGGRSLGGSWWRLCRDDDGGGVDGASTSLGQFLDMERQLAGADFLFGGSGRDPAAATGLFEADGRVRPPQQRHPAAAASEERGRWRLLLPRAPERGSTSSLARLPVLLTGICSGGAG